MIEEDFFWAGYCQGVAIGNVKKQNTYRWGTLEDSNTEKKGALYSIFDTGASSLMIGQMYYDSLITKIMEKVPDVKWSYQKDYRVRTECSADYPSIFFMFDGNWLEVSPHDYIFEQEDGETCILLIMPVETPMNMLGMPIFLDYYTIHDPESGKIGWAPHTGSEKDTVVSGPLPPKYQVLEVRSLPVPPTEPIDWISILVSWTFTSGLIYLSFLGWNKW